jgi:type II secretory pathway predicted ATPase ExeA
VSNPDASSHSALGDKVPSIGDETRRFVGHPLFRKHAMRFALSRLRRNCSYIQTIIYLYPSVWAEDPSGSSKTVIARQLAESLEKSLDRTTAVLATAQSAEQNQDPSLMSELLKSLGISLANLPSQKKMFGECVERLAALALRSSHRFVILIIDEAHRLTIEHFHQLKDLSNQLEKRNLELRLIQLGESPMLGALIDQIAVNKELKSIHNRFHRHRVTIEHYEKSDLNELLTLFDSDPRTELQGKTVLEDMAPHAYELGFRLNVQADQLWEIADTKVMTAGEAFHLARALLLLLSTASDEDLCDESSLKVILSSAVSLALGTS